MILPRRYQLLFALCLWASCAELAWAAGWKSQHEAGSLTIRAEFPLREVQSLVDEVSALQGDIEATLGLEASDRPIEVYLFASKGSYSAYIAQRVPEGVKRRALYVQGKDAGRIYAYRHREMEIDVRHEATHAILHNCLPFVPLWLDEGLAEYFEVPAVDRKLKNPHFSGIKWARRLGGRPNLAALEKKRDLLDMDGDDYRDAWAVVHFMLHGPPAARKVLDDYFRASINGDVPQPFAEAFPAQLGNWGTLFSQHFR